MNKIKKGRKKRVKEIKISFKIGFLLFGDIRGLQNHFKTSVCSFYTNWIAKEDADNQILFREDKIFIWFKPELLIRKLHIELFFKNKWDNV